MTDAEKRFLAAEDGRQFSYFAFISYKHRDMRWGRWLQKKLEGYRLPEELRREKGLPKRVTPVFRDETDIGTGSTVNGLLLDNLSKCKYLLVICSRNMQNEPKYIDYEIEQFRKLGNPAGRIIPVIVDGEACSPDPKQECLPPALLAMGEDRPLGVRVEKGARKRAILKLAATMLNLEIQDLASHEQNRKQRRTIAALTGGFLAAAGLGAFLGWQVLRVSEARLREQNVYAQEAYRRGNLTGAGAMAGQVLAGTNPLMDGSIREEAGRIAVFTSMEGKYLPYTEIGTAGNRQEALFTADGRSILLYDENGVVRYDLEGRETLRFQPDSGIQGIETVSPDGIHAVVRTVRTEDNSPVTALWLWDMERNAPVGSAALVSSGKYRNSDRDRGILDTVVQARFSPDGKVLCAYRIFGFYNANPELVIRDGQTGEPIREIRENLPGNAPGENGRNGEISGFEFVTNRIVHFESEFDHLWVDLDSGEELLVSKADCPEGAAVGYGRYSVHTEAGSLVCRDLGNGRETRIALPEGTRQDRNGILFFAGSCAAGAFEKEDGTCAAVWTADFETMEAGIVLETGREQCFSVAFSAVPDRKAVWVMQGVRSGLKKTRKQRLVRVDVDTRETAEVLNEMADVPAEFRVIGRIGNREAVAVRTGDDTRILEFRPETGTAETWRPEETYDSLASRAILAGNGTEVMAARHGNGWYLYRTEHPGRRLEGPEAGRILDVYDTDRDGNVIAGASGKTMWIWKNGERILEKETDFNVCAVDVAEDGSVVAASSGKRVFLLDGNGEIRAVSPEDAVSGSIVWVGITARSVIALARPDGETLDEWHRPFCILTALARDDLSPAGVQNERVYCLDFNDAGRDISISPDGERYADVEMIPFGDNGFLRRLTVRDTADGKVTGYQYVTDTAETDLESGEMTEARAQNFDFVCFTASGELLTGWAGEVRLTDAETMEVYARITDPSVSSMVPVMLDGDRVICPGDGIRIWNLRTGELLDRISGAESPEGTEEAGRTLLRIVPSPDGRRMAVSDGRKTLVYEIGSGTEPHTLALSPACVIRLDNRQIVYTAADGVFAMPLPAE